MTGMALTKRSWWRRLNKTLLDSEASQFLKEHGDRACEVARTAARIARNKGERRQARHYSHLALRISELSGQKFSQPLTSADPEPPRFRRARPGDGIDSTDPYHS